ncbi:excinuclease ABC subunit A [Pilimelia anulata]|uniref:UvrABC system protein A n=1 Tax=Pilimelia anulata TaxID=53371 RepID=A0A8J3F891_9ACTN|nr:excinuclease ABC subunit A [Pilimelia anulata]
MERHDRIEVRGARENNLRNVDVDIPKRALTVFTGVSGSGKSSLVFGTIAAESQRLINETYTAFVQSFMPSQARPDVDSLRHLSAAIVVDQERMGANSRSTVGTATDAYSMLRLIFSRLGEPHVGPANLFSFNDPHGMCPRCEGSGQVSDVDVDALVDREKSLNEGAITFPNFTVGSWYWKIFAESGYFDPDRKLADYPADAWDRFLHGPDAKLRVGGMNLSYEGLIPKVTRLYLSKDVDALQPHIRAAVQRLATFTTCPDCAGARLHAAALACRVAGRGIADCAAAQVDDLNEWLAGVADDRVAPMVANLRGTLTNLTEIGLGYLSLNRPAGTLSGGEAQRVKMVRHLGSALTDVSYVFDEPTVGLHPHDIARMNDLLRQLRDKGNTVLVVEHKPEVIAIADHIVDLGPGAGADGGHVVYAGTPAGLRAAGTRTGDHLERRTEVKAAVRPPTGQVTIRGADRHNLRDVTVSIPRGVLTAITGVAGSGKSTLIHTYLPRATDVTVVDQSAIRGSRRSNPATYTGLLDGIRKAFAKANGVPASLFSANSEGACPECKGLGLIYTDLQFMSGVTSVCEACEGRRFTAEVLGYRLRGATITDVLAMSVAAARAHFTEKPIRAVLDRLVAAGLPYLTLGQPLNTLSGGERQRLKLAIHLGGTAGVFVLDEPTSGLHMADVDMLIGLLDSIVDGGRTVVVIEHNLDVIARADWVVDLGPGAGHDGGLVVFEGTPAELAGADTLTGKHLRARLAGG